MNFLTIHENFFSTLSQIRTYSIIVSFNQSPFPPPPFTFPSPSRQCDGDARLLDRARLLPPFLENTHQQLPLQAEILELISLQDRVVQHPVRRPCRFPLPWCPSHRMSSHDRLWGAASTGFSIRSWRGKVPGF